MAGEEIDLLGIYTGPKFTGERRPPTGLERMEEYGRLNPQGLADLTTTEGPQLLTGYPVVPGAGFAMGRLRDMVRASQINQAVAAGKPLTSLYNMRPGLSHEIMRQTFPGYTQSYGAHRAHDFMRYLNELMVKAGLKRAPMKDPRLGVPQGMVRGAGGKLRLKDTFIE